jgi:hypothetical protein
MLLWPAFAADVINGVYVSTVSFLKRKNHGRSCTWKAMLLWLDRWTAALLY